MTLARGLSDAEAQALSATLNREGIAVSTEREGRADGPIQVAVTPDAVPRAVAALRALPVEPAPDRELPLLPTRAQERAASEKALQMRLRSALLALPGVRHVAVQVRLAETGGLSELLRPEQPPTAAVSIDMVRDPQQPLDREHVRRLAAQTIPGLTPEGLQLSDRPAADGCRACAELSHLGEVTVTSTSMSTLKLWLGASLLAHMVSAIALLVLLQRRRARSGR